MLFVCHPETLHKQLKWPQEKLKTMLMQNFGVTKKEHYGTLWYFLEWSIFHASRVVLIRNGNQPFGFTVISPLNNPAMTNTNLSILYRRYGDMVWWRDD